MDGLGESFLKTLGGELLDLLGDLAVAGGVADVLKLVSKSFSSKAERFSYTLALGVADVLLGGLVARHVVGDGTLVAGHDEVVLV